MAAPGAKQPREVFFEFIVVGTSVKVCAIDADSGLEVSIVGPVQASKSQLKRTALAKLTYVLNKEQR